MPLIVAHYFSCRQEYDSAINNIDVTVLQSQQYGYNRGALHLKSSSDDTPKKLALDRRKTVADLKDDVVKLVGKGQGV